jgi:hypothetical protein
VIAFSPDDDSPSRARLGRVAAMLREAEEAIPGTASRQRGSQEGGTPVPLLRRRAGVRVPAPRAVN